MAKEVREARSSLATACLDRVLLWSQAVMVGLCFYKAVFPDQVDQAGQKWLYGVLAVVLCSLMRISERVSDGERGKP